MLFYFLFYLLSTLFIYLVLINCGDRVRAILFFDEMRPLKADLDQMAPFERQVQLGMRDVEHQPVEVKS